MKGNLNIEQDFEANRGIGLSRRPNVGHEVTRLLREGIVSGTYPPRRQMRVDSLASEFGVSTMPVREALAALASEGLVEGAPHRGVKVVPVGRDDILDVFAIHAFCAAELTRRAAMLLDPGDIETLNGIQRSIEQVASRRQTRTQSFRRIEELNFQFHRTINSKPEAGRLRWFLRTATRFIPRQYYATPGWVQATLDQHPSIVDALEARDAERSAVLMSEHILASGKLVVQAMERAGFWQV